MSPKHPDLFSHSPANPPVGGQVTIEFSNPDMRGLTVTIDWSGDDGIGHSFTMQLDSEGNGSVVKTFGTNTSVILSHVTSAPHSIAFQSPLRRRSRARAKAKPARRKTR